MNILNLFCKKKYIPVWTGQSVWNITDFGDYTINAFYIIEWCKDNGKYRIKTSGYRPTKHRFYGTVLQILCNFNKYGHDKVNVEYID